MERVYFVTLAKDTESPLKPKSDEVEIAKDDAKKDPKAAETPRTTSRPTATARTRRRTPSRRNRWW